jgi:DNA-binding transcriptional ArsR family regulator
MRAGAAEPMNVSIALSAQQSVVSLLHQAASGQTLGVPADFLGSIRGALRPQSRFAAQPFAACDGMLIPDSCTPISPLADASVADQADRLRDLPVTALTDELQVAFGDGLLPAHWRGAADVPRRWLNSLADASLDTWTVAEARWRAAGPLLDREIRRVGTAAVRGGMAALLNTLHPRITYYDDGTCVIRARSDPSVTFGPFSVGPRRLALVPTIAGRDLLLFNFGLPDFCYIGYPVPQPRLGAQDAANSALAAIVGPVRAAMLQALRRPQTVHGLAAAVYCAPTTATYHLHHLDAAGLITRERSGTSVWVRRSARGDELVDLLSD